MSEATSSNSTASGETHNKNSPLFWFLSMLFACAALAWVMGSATPRVRLIGLFPIAIGALVAYGGVMLLDRFELKLSRFAYMFLLLLAAGTVAGTAFQSYRIWVDRIFREHAESRSQINNFLKDAPEEQRQHILKENARQLRSRTSFPYYLSRRLDSFAQQLGKREAWEPPIPEIIFGVELFLAFVGALVVLQLVSSVERKQHTAEEEPPS